MKDSAAHNLLGLNLKTGWEVFEEIKKTPISTGMFFSVCYKVRKNGEVCFLKAFDFTKFFQIHPGRSVVDVMTEMLNAYKYEKDLSNLCKNNHVTKVVFVKDSGEENVPGFTIPTVPYLIFELADGDVRKLISFSGQLDFVWRFKSLHSIAVGLKQLHNIEVSHQDLKPSNILILNKESKIGDLGRSICRTLQSPYDGEAFTGDYNYAPPEIMYNEIEPDWNKRVFAADCYLLGSLIVFYFSGISMTALLSKHVPQPFHWEKWDGGYTAVEPYIINAFTYALDEFESCIQDEYFKTELRWLVEKLCNPLPQKRGDPINLEHARSPYKLERFITKFDLLHYKARIKVIQNGKHF